MRCHQVVAVNPKDNIVHAVRYCASEKEARDARVALMEITKLRKKDITIEPLEIPNDKAGLLQWLNDIFRKIDIGGM